MYRNTSMVGLKCQIKPTMMVLFMGTLKCFIFFFQGFSSTSPSNSSTFLSPNPSDPASSALGNWHFNLAFLQAIYTVLPTAIESVLLQALALPTASKLILQSFPIFQHLSHAWNPCIYSISFFFIFTSFSELSNERTLAAFEPEGFRLEQLGSATTNDSPNSNPSKRKTLTRHLLLLLLICVFTSCTFQFFLLPFLLFSFLPQLLFSLVFLLQLLLQPCLLLCVLLIPLLLLLLFLFSPCFLFHLQSLQVCLGSFSGWQHHSWWSRYRRSHLLKTKLIWFDHMTTRPQGLGLKRKLLSRLVLDLSDQLCT